MDDYIVEFRKGNKVLEKMKFSTLNGIDGAEFHILMNSLDKNLDKDYNWIIRRKHGDWFKKYDNNGRLVSLCGIDPVELVVDEALRPIRNIMADYLKQEKE